MQGLAPKTPTVTSLGNCTKHKSNWSDGANILGSISHNNFLTHLDWSPLFVDMVYVCFVTCNGPEKLEFWGIV